MIIESIEFYIGVGTILVGAAGSFFAVKGKVDNVSQRVEKIEVDVKETNDKLDKEIEQNRENTNNIAQNLAILINDMKHLSSTMDEIKKKLDD